MFYYLELTKLLIFSACVRTSSRVGNSG
jgi:hypothetical protein